MLEFAAQGMRSPMVMIGLFSLAGLLLQKKKSAEILGALCSTFIGYTMMIYGSRMITEAVTAYLPMLQNAFRIFGMMPNNESMSAILQVDYGYETSLIFASGMLFNLVFARILPIKFIYLNGSHVLYMAALVAAVSAIHVGSDLIHLILFGALLGLLLTVLPALTYPFVKRIIGERGITVGFCGITSCVAAGCVGRLIYRLREPSGEAPKTQVYKARRIGIFSDSNVILSLSMLLVYIVTSLFTDKDIIHDISGGNHFLLFAVKYSFIFSAGFYIILTGVRMFVEHFILSFMGIREKVVPNSIAAVDPSILFPYNPSLVIVGFLCSLAGGLMGIFLQYQLRLLVVIPAILSHFFSGAASAFMGYSWGGRKGAVLGSFLQGLIISFVPIFVIALLEPVRTTRMCFADADFGLVGLLTYLLSRLLALFLG